MEGLFTQRECYNWEGYAIGALTLNAMRGPYSKQFYLENHVDNATKSVMYLFLGNF